MAKIDDTRTFFIHLNGEEPIYFNIIKEAEIYKIYLEKIAKMQVYNNEPIIPSAHSIELTKNNFTLKNNTGEVICDLKKYYKLINQTYPINTPEIVALYIDADMREKMLTRGQLQYDVDASRIPGVLYEPITSQSKTYTRRKI